MDQIEICDNAEGCSSLQEVENACATTAVEDRTPRIINDNLPQPCIHHHYHRKPSQRHPFHPQHQRQQLLQQEITAPATTIDVSRFTSGVYVVKVVGEKGVQVGKFIKQ